MANSLRSQSIWPVKSALSRNSFLWSFVESIFCLFSPSKFWNGVLFVFFLHVTAGGKSYGWIGAVLRRKRQCLRICNRWKNTINYGQTCVEEGKVTIFGQQLAWRHYVAKYQLGINCSTAGLHFLERTEKGEFSCGCHFVKVMFEFTFRLPL